ncbi:AAA family ATPase [Nocardia sp. BSTN01]|nr:AAA family ATPase [Nocardia sp. BSTN01]
MSELAMIIVCGPPGSGKTTLSGDLCERFRLLGFSTDEIGVAIRSAMLDYAAVTATEYLQSARAALLLLWRKALRLNISCLHDATIPSPETWHILAEVAASAEAKFYVIQLDADQDTLFERAATRTSNQVRRFDRAHIALESEVARVTYSSTLPAVADRYIVIDTSRLSCRQVVDAAAGFLREGGLVDGLHARAR